MNCGSPIAPVAGPAAPAAAAPFPGYAPYAYAPSPVEAVRHKQISRTRKGILLLLIGALLGWIPNILGAIGALLTLVGAILVILGRKAFGQAHRRNVAISIVLFFVGFAFFIVGGIIAAIAVISASPTSSEAALTAALQSAFTNILVIVAIGAFISGLASVFFTYALQKNEGRIALWAAYVGTAGIQVAIIVLTLPLIPGIAASIAHDIVTTGHVDATRIANAVSGAESSLQYLSVIPSLLYAAANYLAWSRINKGEIPPPSVTPPGVGTAPGPPAPPINPI